MLTSRSSSRVVVELQSADRPGTAYPEGGLRSRTPGACVDAHAAQSEQSRQLAQLSALPACARNAVDLGPFLLAIVD